MTTLVNPGWEAAASALDYNYIVTMYSYLCMTNRPPVTSQVGVTIPGPEDPSAKYGYRCLIKDCWDDTTWIPEQTAQVKQFFGRMYEAEAERFNLAMAEDEPYYYEGAFEPVEGSVRLQGTVYRDGSFEGWVEGRGWWDGTGDIPLGQLRVSFSPHNKNPSRRPDIKCNGKAGLLEDTRFKFKGVQRLD